MVITMILLGLSSVLFVVSLIMLGRVKGQYALYKEDIERVQKVIDDNVKLSTQLYKLYSVLQDNQNLQLKAVEVMSKNQKMTAADLIELRDQVSNTLVAIIEQIGGSSVNVETLKKDDDDVMN